MLRYIECGSSIALPQSCSTRLWLLLLLLQEGLALAQ
jgi:hypothetical protein